MILFKIFLSIYSLLFSYYLTGFNSSFGWILLVANFILVINSWNFSLSKNKVLILGILTSVLFVLFMFNKSPLFFNKLVYNFDYHKYNFLISEISEDPHIPCINIRADKKQHLSYYVGIFLPAAWIGNFTQNFLEKSFIQLVERFFFILGLMIGFFYSIYIYFSQKIYFSKRQFLVPILFIFSFQLDGIETIIRYGINNSITDIEWGQLPLPYFPLRFQSILSMLFWIPGHLVSAVLYLAAFSLFQKNTTQININFITLILLVAISFSFFPLISIIFITLASKKNILFSILKKSLNYPIHLFIIINYYMLTLLLYSINFQSIDVFKFIVSKEFTLISLVVSTVLIFLLKKQTMNEKKTSGSIENIFQKKSLLFYFEMISFVIVVIGLQISLKNNILILKEKFFYFLLKEYFFIIILNLLLYIKKSSDFGFVFKLSIGLFIGTLFLKEDFFMSGMILINLILTSHIIFELIRQNNFTYYFIYTVLILPSLYFLTREMLVFDNNSFSIISDLVNDDRFFVEKFSWIFDAYTNKKISCWK
ncbi:MAG: hypothetical protein SFU98_15050 [Leptospiraceae bacterium]|nr:hypothetical protein [Leptospiraceae bacterium]